ncbi:hypothetical protein T484DRAFT_1811043 [Baffinella frigidus]|nr:hypothetical protein T484DRAFT_1811043 [Cryptophyta sp. CCMP2293]
MSRANLLLLALGLLLLTGFPSADSHWSITAGVQIDPVCGLRPGTDHHASEAWDHERCCAHCRTPFKARVLSKHEGICPEAQIKCPNVGCGETVARRSMAEHRGACGREEVQCPCPGCEERMARAEVGEHVEAAGVVHLRNRVAEMEERMSDLQTKVAGQGETIAALQSRAPALTRVFTWSTGSAGSRQQSLPCTFTDGVRGHCFNGKSGFKHIPHYMGFALEEGPASTMHFQCSILDKNDKVLRVVSSESVYDVRRPPAKISPVGERWGASFDLSEADKAGAVRADGSIKLRMVVHLYLPE